MNTKTLVLYNMNNEPLAAFIFFNQDGFLAEEVAKCVKENVPYAVFAGDITAPFDLVITKLN